MIVRAFSLVLEKVFLGKMLVQKHDEGKTNLDGYAKLGKKLLCFKETLLRESHM